MVPRACRGAFSLRLAKNARSWQATIRRFGSIRGIESNGAPSLPRGFQSSTATLLLRCRMAHHVYILRCADGTLYVGSAQDLDERLKAHNDGRGAAHTFKRRPVRLVHSEAFDSQDRALARERQLKHWSHGKKQALIDGNLERLKQLSRRRS
jgi:putative endonuclease